MRPESNAFLAEACRFYERTSGLLNGQVDWMDAKKKGNEWVVAGTIEHRDTYQAVAFKISFSKSSGVATESLREAEAEVKELMGRL